MMYGRPIPDACTGCGISVVACDAHAYTIGGPCCPGCDHP